MDLLLILERAQEKLTLSHVNVFLTNRCCFHADTFLPYMRNLVSHASLCALRWTQFYYKSNYNIADIEGYDQGDSGCMISAVSCKKSKRVTVLSQQDKYRKASHITTKLASLVSEAPMREFKQKLSTLEDILKVWEQCGRCTIQECEGQLYVAYYIIYGVICNSNCNGNSNDYMILV